jgi:hypothetical protein
LEFETCQGSVKQLFFIFLQTVSWIINSYNSNFQSRFQQTSEKSVWNQNKEKLRRKTISKWEASFQILQDLRIHWIHRIISNSSEKSVWNQNKEKLSLVLQITASHSPDKFQIPNQWNYKNKTTRTTFSASHQVIQFCENENFKLTATTCTCFCFCFCFCFCHVIASFIMLKIMQWLLDCAF